MAFKIVKTETAKASRTIRARCLVSPKGKPCGGGPEAAGACQGVVEFCQDGDTCTISWNIAGLSPGKHGIHIHEKADFSNGCASAGPHYNPFGKTHGGPHDKERHVGDLGNIEAGKDGIARGKIVDHLVKLRGKTSVIGRSVMIHEDEDDLGCGDNSQPGPPPVNGKCSKITGNAGARIACGEIKLVTTCRKNDSRRQVAKLLGKRGRKDDKTPVKKVQDKGKQQQVASHAKQSLGQKQHHLKNHGKEQVKRSRARR